jgi:undecaprenyl-diphosphatase
VLFGGAIEALFESPFVPATAFLVTGAILWSTRKAPGLGDRRGDQRGDQRGEGPEQWKPLGWRAALLIGFAQAFALVPGISRSGTTVAMGLWLGVAAEEAAAFSFLMAIPAIAGAALLQMPDLAQDGLTVSGAALAVGSVVAAVTGILAIKGFVALLERKTFHLFAIYCWALGLAFLTYLIVLG